MNYQQMSHQIDDPRLLYTSSAAPIPNYSTNRFIYVKHNFLNPNVAPKVLVNPHFKKKVFINPQFTQNLLTKPKIHVNPNVLKNFTNKVAPITPAIETKSTTVIATRNKLVRVPCDSINNQSRKRRTSINTKYKIVRSSGTKSGAINKFKLDKRERVKPKKKYVYVNRFLSIDVVAKNVLLKKNSNLLKPGFVNINGILYKKSPNSLKKASLNKTLKLTPKSIKNTSLIKKSKYKLVRKDSKENQASPRRSLVKRYKVIRSKKTQTPSKLHKCNIPCPIYRKYGKCPLKNCYKLHNPDQVVLCTKFLQGACHKEHCLLSHKVSNEKMPTCKFYLEGLCFKDNCPYLHVKISPKAEICRDFLEGFCKKGAECDKRHQYLCPDFEKNKKCVKRRCPYPHGNKVVRKCKFSSAKKCSVKKKKTKLSENDNNRYYKDSDKVVETVIKTVSRERPKLGELPSFIPFGEDS